MIFKFPVISALILLTCTLSRAQSPAGSLPAPWQHRDIGKASVPGKVDFDGERFTIKASETYADSKSDQFHFVYFMMDSVGELTVRLVPQNTQLSRIGLMMRESLTASSSQVSVVVSPFENGKETGWQALELSRGMAGQPLVTKNIGDVLTEPIVSNGQLTSYYWLRLQRKFNSFFAFTSLDGKTWTSLGSTFVEMKKKFYIGITVTSGLKDVTTTVVVDNVSVR